MVMPEATVRKGLSIAGRLRVTTLQIATDEQPDTTKPDLLFTACIVLSTEFLSARRDQRFRTALKALHGLSLVRVPPSGRGTPSSSEVATQVMSARAPGLNGTASLHPTAPVAPTDQHLPMCHNQSHPFHRTQHPYTQYLNRDDSHTPPLCPMHLHPAPCTPPPSPFILAQPPSAAQLLRLRCTAWSPRQRLAAPPHASTARRVPMVVPALAVAFPTCSYR